MDLKEQANKLIDEFGNAALRAGQSNNGAIYDPFGGNIWKVMQDLRKNLFDTILALPIEVEETLLQYEGAGKIVRTVTHTLAEAIQTALEVWRKGK